MSSKNDPPVCEVCGKPATCFVRDVETTYSGLTGIKYSRPSGPPHRFCTEHDRDAAPTEIPPMMDGSPAFQ
jgi:hypothetical protein